MRGVAERTVTALVAAHERYADRHGPWPGDGPGLLAAIDLARDALTTLVRFREVDDGPRDAVHRDVRAGAARRRVGRPLSLVPGLGTAG